MLYRIEMFKVEYVNTEMFKVEYVELRCLNYVMSN